MMKPKLNFESGYVGLLMLLISVALIVFILVRSDIFTGGKTKDNKSILEVQLDAVNQAKDVKGLVQERNQQTDVEAAQ